MVLIKVEAILVLEVLKVVNKYHNSLLRKSMVIGANNLSII